jgi:hypothetical protein
MITEAVITRLCVFYVFKQFWTTKNLDYMYGSLKCCSSYTIHSWCRVLINIGKKHCVTKTRSSILNNYWGRIGYMRNYQGQNLCSLPKPDAKNTNRGQNNSVYRTRTELGYCFIINFTCLFIGLRVNAFYTTGFLWESQLYFSAFGISSIN